LKPLFTQFSGSSIKDFTIIGDAPNSTGPNIHTSY
jgi:hypothetical protein